MAPAALPGWSTGRLVRHDSAAVHLVISNCVISLSADMPRVLAEAFRVLRPGGRLGVSDVIAGADLEPGPRAQAEADVAGGCVTLTGTEYQDALRTAGFNAITIMITNDAGGGLHSAIIKAVKPSLSGEQTGART